MSVKKKILYIHHDEGKSGASRSLSFILDKINPEKYDARVNCIFNGPVLELYKDKPVQLVIGRGIFPFHGSTVSGMYLELFLRNIIRIPQTLYYASKLIRNQKPDLIHLNSSALFIVAMVAKLVNKNIKTVCHVREPLLKYSLSAKIIKYMCYLFVDHFIAIDRHTGSTMKTKKNLSIIYNSVNFEDYNHKLQSTTLRDEFNLSGDAVIFLYLARITRVNGALELVRVANAVNKTHLNFHFVLAGFPKNNMSKYANKIAKESADNPNIHLTKFRKDVPSIIASSDVTVVPFTVPHFARAIVESSAIGKPSIGANIGGVNELIIDQKTGLLYDNEQEFYNCCIKLGTDKVLRNKMGNAALEFAKGNFDNNISSSRIFNVYDNLLNQ